LGGFACLKNRKRSAFPSENACAFLIGIRTAMAVATKMFRLTLNAGWARLVLLVN